MAGFLDDVRLGARVLRRSPAHTWIVVGTLAIGVAVCTLVFAIVNAVLYRPFDKYRQPERLVLLFEQNARQGVIGPTSEATFLDWKRSARSVEQMAAIGRAPMTLVGTGEPDMLFGGAITDGFLGLIDARSRCGRLFASADYLPGAPPVVLLADGLWQRRFGGSCEIVGRALSLNGRPVIVAGVLARDTAVKPLIGIEPEVLAPLRSEPAADRSTRSVLVAARLKPGATLARADAEMQAIGSGLSASDAANRGWTVYVKAARGLDLRGDAAFVVVLTAAVLFVLLIVCANTTNLLLARGMARSREIATRRAMGAGRWRIARQFLTETAMLGLAGSFGAVLLAYFACRLLVWRLASTSIGWIDLQVDWRVLAFAASLSVGAAILAAVVPAFRLARASILAGLKQQMPGRRTGTMRACLVAGEIALSLVLLVGAGLLLEGVMHLRQNDPGFRTDGLVTISTTLSDGRYDRADAKTALVEQAVGRIADRGEIQAATASSFLPLAGAEVPVSAFTIHGLATAGDARPAAGVISVTAGYFRTLGIPVKAGRAFAADDREAALPVAIVNGALAKRWFGGLDPIGSEIELDGIRRTVVGIVGNVRNFHLNVAPAAAIYVPFSQRPSSSVAFIARTRSADPAPAVAALKAALHSVDANQPVRGGQTMQAIVARSMGGFDMTMLVVGLVAAVALGLAAIGVYGVVAFSVARRTREIGVRVALGATPARVIGHVLGGGLRLAAFGGVPGLLLAAAVGRLLAARLHRVSPVDPVIFLSVPLVLLATVVLACYVPARRAARVDPVTATRSD